LGVAPKDTSSGANQRTGGAFIVLEPVDAHIALDGEFPIIIKLHGPERAGFNTGFATDAGVLVNQDDALLISRDRLYRA
jgi:hypothetical protein